MKGKIRRIIAIALMVCFIASLTAASASACTCTLHSYLFSGNQDLVNICKGWYPYSLHYGSSGEAVKLVQTGLWNVGFPPTDRKIDGYFGTNTENAVKAYQSHKGYLTPDGKVGPFTLRALDQDVARHEGYPY